MSKDFPKLFVITKPLAKEDIPEIAKYIYVVIYQHVEFGGFKEPNRYFTEGLAIEDATVDKMLDILVHKDFIEVHNNKEMHDVNYARIILPTESSIKKFYQF